MNKAILLLLAVVVLILCVNPLLARGKLQGYAVKGGKIVQSSPLTSNRLVESFPSCTVTIYLTGTSTLATIYSDNSSTPKSNPFTADSTGFFFFYADNGRYDVRFSGTGIASPFTVADQLLYDETSDLATVSNIGQAKLDTAPASANNPIAVGVNSLLVLNKLNCYNPDAYGAVAGDSGDDRSAFVTALAAANLTKSPLCINANAQYKISSAIPITSNTIIVGGGGNGYDAGGTRLLLTSNNESIFSVGEGVYNVTFANLDLRADTGTSNVQAIKFSGAYPNSSQFFEIYNVTIAGFTRGIHIDATDAGNEWQAEQIHINKSIFRDNTYGIRVDAKNAGLNIENTTFYTTAAGYALYADNIGILRWSYSFGLRTYTTYCDSYTAGYPYTPTYNSNLGEAMIYLNGQHSTVYIDTAIAEGVKYFLVNNYESLLHPVVITNSIITDISITADLTLVSEANTYYVNSVVSAGANNDTRIHSRGDSISSLHKCLAAGTGSGFVLSGGSRIVQYASRDGNQLYGTTTIGQLNAPANTDESSTTVPPLRIGTDTTLAASGKPLFEAGEVSSGAYTQKFTFSRNQTNGFFQLTPSQAAPYQGQYIIGALALKTDASSGLVAPAANSGLFYYDQSTNLFKGVENGVTAVTFLRTTGSFTANRLGRATSTSGLFANSLLSDDGTNVTLTSGNFTMSSGNLVLTSGNTTLTAGNLTMTNGNFGITSGNATLTSGNLAMLAGRFYNSTSVTFANADATPSVLSSNFFVTNNGGATSITDFDDGVAGQVITILCGDANTTITDAGNLVMAGNLVCTLDDTITFRRQGTKWYELYRSVN